MANRNAYYLAAWADRRRRRWALLLGTFAPIPFEIALRSFRDFDRLVIGAHFLAVIVALIFYIVFRCPRCGSMFNYGRAPSEKRCCNCGLAEGEVPDEDPQLQAAQTSWARCLIGIVIAFAIIIFEFARQWLWR